MKTTARDHQKRIQYVRFTPNGSERRAPMQSKQLEQKSKLQLGTIKMDLACPTYPKWVRKKSAEAMQTMGAAIKNRHQDYQEWIHH